MPSIKPVNNQLLVEIIPFTQMGSLFLPDTFQNKEYQKGRIVAVGAGARTAEGSRMPISEELCVGDAVLFRISGVDWEEDDKKYKLITESSILGILTDAGKTAPYRGNKE